jgi:hypothetical protein
VDFFIDLGMYISMDYVGWMQGRSFEVHPAGVRKGGGEWFDLPPSSWVMLLLRGD